jgi:RHS repeat-associated protein
MNADSCFGDDPRLVGDPVNTLTGAVVDRTLDFRLTGPLELRWYRHYDSSQSHRRFSLGNGCAHEYDRSLSFTSDGMLYEEPVGRAYAFPPLTENGQNCRLHGLTLKRLSPSCFRVRRHAMPDMEFVFSPSARHAPITRLLQGSAEIRFHYGNRHALVGIDDSVGRRIECVVDEQNRVLRMALKGTPNSADTTLVKYLYDERDNLIATEVEAGHGYGFAYDDANRVILRRGRSGFRFHFKYDSQGRCIQAVGDDRLYTIALEYSVPRRLTKVTRADGGVWTYRFTTQGGLQEIRDPLGGARKFVRDESGRTILELDPNGNATRLVYNSAGELVTKIDPFGYSIEQPPNPSAAGPRAHRVAANAAEYELGRLLQVHTIGLPDHAQAQRLELSAGARSSVFFRERRPVSSSPQKKFTVPPLGVLWWPDPQTAQNFDVQGKLISQEDGFGRMRRWRYNEVGNETEYVDFDAAKWTYQYGPWFFLRSTLDPLGAETRFSHSEYGKMASCTDAGGTCSEYKYDQVDNLVSVSRDGVIRELYTRDAAGNLIAKHAGDGRELLRIEVGRGNLAVKRVLASGDLHTMSYDVSGRLVVGETRNDTVEFVYDKFSNRISEKRNGRGVDQRFEDRGTPSELTFLDRFTVGYSRSGERIKISDPGGQTQELVFHRHGVVERRFTNRRRETAQYDNRGRCLLKLIEDPGAHVWLRRYHWSGESELTRIEDNQRGDLRHEYDAAHRLVRRFGQELEHYRLDAAGNLFEQPGLDASIADGNRMASANGEQFRYNDRGDVASRHGPDGETRYFYDSCDQLIRVETPRGVWSADYDTLGRRTRSTWLGRTTEFFWNTDQLQGEINADGALRLYVYADPLALTPLLVFDYASVDADPAAGRRYFVHSNQIAAPIQLSDDAGNQVWAARINSYGTIELHGKTLTDFRLRFPGHYFDAELGLHYNRFRYYDPVLGRYLQTDPSGIAGGINLYAYLANPLARVDVRGLGDPHPPPEDDEENRPETEANGGAAAAPPKSASESLPPLKGMSRGQVGEVLSENGFNRTRVSNSPGQNETWDHPDGSQVRVHPYGNEREAPYKSANNAHAHKEDPAGNQLNDSGQPSNDPNETHIGLSNPADLPAVRNRPHGAGN